MKILKRMIDGEMYIYPDEVIDKLIEKYHLLEVRIKELEERKD